MHGLAPVHALTKLHVFRSYTRREMHARVCVYARIWGYYGVERDP